MIEKLENLMGWSLTRKKPWRLFSVFFVAGGMAFLAYMILGTLTMGWWSPMSLVFAGAIGCGIGTGLVNAVLNAR